MVYLVASREAGEVIITVDLARKVGLAVVVTAIWVVDTQVSNSSPKWCMQSSNKLQKNPELGR